MTASIQDKITNVSSGTRPVSTTVATLRATGATSLACNDLTGWATDTAVHFVTYKIDGQGKVVVGSQTDWKGIVSANTINSLTVTGGIDSGNATGDVVEILPTARWEKDLTDALRVEHNQDGTHASALLAKLYPIGSIYMNATSSTNPSTLLGFGTWVSFGAGRVPVGIDTTQTEFSAAGQTGGTKTVDASHTHRHFLSVGESSGNVLAIRPDSIPNATINNTATSTTGTVQSPAANAVELWTAPTLTGGNSSQSVIQPYVTVYMWNRTA